MTRATRSMVERGEEHVDGSVAVPADIARRAAVRVADHLAAEHPQETDGKRLGRNPFVAAELLLLLDALGLREAS